MRLADQVQMAWRGVLAHPARSLLTMLGIGVGIAAVVLLTSIGQGEAAPVAVMEAMSCGLPCIVSIIGGTADMIRDGEDGLLVPQEDVEAIAAALRKLVTDPDLRRAMGQAARTSAEEKFDHHRNAIALYEAIRG